MTEKSVIIQNSVFLVLISLLGKSFEECLCNVRLRGEYCGSELNQRNGNNDCDKHIYFCGDNNHNREAVLITKCNDWAECEKDQFTLSSRTRRRNSCFRRFRCQCPRGLDRGPHCGNKLIGDDCPPDMIFSCGLRDGVNSRDACPQGCKDGKCNNSVNSRAIESDSDSDREN